MSKLKKAQQRDQTSMGLLTEPGEARQRTHIFRVALGRDIADNSALFQGKSLWERYKYVIITV
ncbi:MAG: hypothetical protein PVH77_03100 [Phycisphaerales bacterium]